MPLKEIAHSGFLDLVGHGIVADESVASAYHLSSSEFRQLDDSLPFPLHVAIVLNRVSSPDALLNRSWASRSRKLKDLRDSDRLWFSYGADEKEFNQAVNLLRDKLGLSILDSSNSSYTTSAASRTIWLQLNSAADFKSLFGVTPQVMQSRMTTFDNPMIFWDGNLSIDDRISISGLWFDSEFIYPPSPSDQTPHIESEPLPEGPLSIGNGVPLSGGSYSSTPYQISQLYQFPLRSNLDVLAGTTLGLIQPTIGDAVVLGSKPLEDLITSYNPKFTGRVTSQGFSAFSDGPDQERNLDVSVSASINPATSLRLYAGSRPESASGISMYSSTFGALHAATWDQKDDRPEVLSNSYNDAYFLSPGSPFLSAYHQLFQDLALQGMSLVTAAGDHGSTADVPFGSPGNEVSLGNGLANVPQLNSNPYGLTVGGTSLSVKAATPYDQTLNSSDGKVSADLVGAAAASDLQVLWQLIKGGLKAPWSALRENEYFVETIWNELANQDYTFKNILGSAVGAGGVSTTQPLPHYQRSYGISPASDSPNSLIGRGLPDVSAAAGGNLEYYVLSSFGSNPESLGGTSASAPLWASLAIQLNRILRDQDPSLPTLGYMNDLIYQASAISPPSFNDITLGNNISSFAFDETGSYTALYDDNVFRVKPKPFGYYATDGYDLASGLGTPNGLLLARAISALVHAQTSTLKPLPILTNDAIGRLKSAANQALLLQPTMTTNGTWHAKNDRSSVRLPSSLASQYGWTSRFAQQTLQPDFSSELIRLFDRQSLGPSWQLSLDKGDQMNFKLNHNRALTPQASLTADHGFVDYVADSSQLKIARPVAVALTAGQKDDQEAIVRLRQVGRNNLSLRFYRVDNLTGMIDGISPYDPGYEHALEGRLYRTVSGESEVHGGGYGKYSEDRLTGVDHGDLIAMTLRTSKGYSYHSFPSARADSSVSQPAQLRNFGFNTWGWEDGHQGGDYDYNDLIVQLDFVSTSGSGLLI